MYGLRILVRSPPTSTIARARRIASPTQLSASLQKLYDAILDPASTAAEFRDFYSFLFPFLKIEGAKTLPAEIAIPLWSVSIAQRYELGQSFVDFAEVRVPASRVSFRTPSQDVMLMTGARTGQSRGSAFKAVSVDVWTQLLEFCQSVEPDLTGWSEDDACEWAQARLVSTRSH